MRYAADTYVSVEKSKAEIEQTLTRFGADEFQSGWRSGEAVVAFRCHGWFVRFILALPDKTEERFLTTPGKRRQRSEDDVYRAWEQACRQKWRALALCIKAKLVAVEEGVTTFEDEFLAHITLPNGRAVREMVSPQLKLAYETKTMPASLLALPHKRRAANHGE
jgi:hypothetical protein